MITWSGRRSAWMNRNTPPQKKKLGLWVSRLPNLSGERCAKRFHLRETGLGCALPASWNQVIGGRASPSMRSSMARKAECYVDTSALIAFLDRSDSYHPQFKRLFSQPPPLV